MTQLRNLPTSFTASFTGIFGMMKGDISPFVASLADPRYPLRVTRIAGYLPFGATVDADFLNYMFAYPQIYGKGKLYKQRSAIYLGDNNIVAAESEDEFYQIMMEFLHKFTNAGGQSKMDKPIQSMIDAEFDLVDEGGGHISDLSLWARGVVGRIGTELLVGQNLTSKIGLIDRYFELGSFIAAKSKTKGPEFEQFQAAKAQLFGLCEDLIADEIPRLPEEGKLSNILQVLILMDRDPRIQAMIASGKLDKDWIIHNVITFFIGLADTTRSAMAMGLNFLAVYKEYQNALRAEAKGPIGYRDLRANPYLESGVMETLRVTSPAPVTLRETLLPDNYGRYRIPSGLLIVAPLDVIMTSDRYFGEGEKFIYDRHLLEQQEVRTYYAPAFVPFGGGGRKCWAWILAMMTLGQTNNTAVRRYSKIVSVAGADAQPYTNMTRKAAKGMAIQCIK